ncbi:Uma2 family endonuclease [Pleurocapsales cyanobacterium LEGE 06147]|nr:Uma2 family endonuclease [Pleurocapsales cyanobacterium LEGE 06147]
MSQMATGRVRWTVSDVELLAADEWKRYEIIDGELFVTRAPHWGHQNTAGNIHAELRMWSQSTGQGRTVPTPGIIFTEADSVIPDVVWISNDRLAVLLDEAGHLTGAPELVVEVLSPGAMNERRDKEAKLKLYSVQGVQEYWIVDWRLQQMEIYRRDNAQLTLVTTLLAGDEITSPLLPDFRCPIQRFFA